MSSPSDTTNRALFVAPAEDLDLSLDDVFTRVDAFTVSPTEATTSSYEVLLCDGEPMMRCTRCSAPVALSLDEDGDPVIPERTYHFDPCGKATP